LSRLYYHEAADGLYFASEAKALLGALPQLRQVDGRGLAEYFACGSPLQNRTLFRDVFLLPPASAWTLDRGGSVRKRRYFNPATWESLVPLPEADYYEKLRTTFARILPRYFCSDDSLTVSLTGGLDSRMIMAWLGESHPHLTTYSNRGVFNECADASIARRVAMTCRYPHRLVTVDQQFFAEFPSLAEQTVYVTDGAMEVVGAAGLYANRKARSEIARVRITGNYGGEVLRGIVTLKPLKLTHAYHDSEFETLIQEGRETLAAERKVPTATFIAFKQVPWHHYSRFAMENSTWAVRSPYLDNELVPLAYERPIDTRKNQQFAARLIRDGNPALAGFPTDRGPLGRTGLFGRLGETYQEFTFRCEYVYDYGMPRWLVNVDRMLSPLHIERLLLGRHKYYHFRYFYRFPLASYVRDVLLDSRSLGRSYLKRANVERLVTEHTTGRANYTTEIHALLSTELIHRLLIER
jgi:asparagine synthase (glutamine-hydrolysing)